jgi:hypothetical protein
MKKYYIGLAVIALFTLGATTFTVVKGLASKQDNITEERARDIANKLNAFISKERKLPNSLDEAGITDVPSTIKYEKTSESTYNFCTTYKEASSYGFSDGITPLLSGGAVSQFAEDNSTTDSQSTYTASTLYPSYYHKKGETCQTIKPYLFSNSYNSYNYNSSTPTISNGSSAASISARDTERQTDIKALHAQIEAYYAQNGNYPTLANLNNTDWRATNMKGLDKEALRDPKGYSYVLYSSAYKNFYSYAVTGENQLTCDNLTKKCTAYILTATLEAGGTYTKQSLN